MSDAGLTSRYVAEGLLSTETALAEARGKGVVRDGHVEQRLTQLELGMHGVLPQPRWKPPGVRGLVTRFPCLDVRPLAKVGFFGAHRDQVLAFDGYGERGSTVWLRAVLEPEPMVVLFSPDIAGLRAFKIWLIGLPHHGTTRWLLRCPQCGGRTSAVYLRNGGLGCRHCQRLTYPSQMIGKGVRRRAREAREAEHAATVRRDRALRGARVRKVKAACGTGSG